MALNYVVVTGNLGSDYAYAQVIFTLNETVTDTTNDLVLIPDSVEVTCDYQGKFTTETEDGASGIIATDNSHLSPASPTYTIEIVPAPGSTGGVKPVEWTTVTIAYGTGATQDLSSLV